MINIQQIDFIQNQIQKIEIRTSQIISKSIRKNSQYFPITLLMSQNYKKTKNIPAFLLKLYQMLEDPNIQCAIIWSSNGIGFAIVNEQVLTNKVLPKYFKHSNYSSFIRQLNMYDFHKSKKGNLENYFHHDKFIQGDLHSISQIKRKPEKKKGLKSISNKKFNQNERFYCQSEISSQKIYDKNTINKTQITLNSVHTIKAKSQQSIILMRDNIDKDFEQNNGNQFSQVYLHPKNSFQNEEQMDDESSKMSINNEIQSKSLIENYQRQILASSINNMFTFISPYQFANFGLFI